MVGAPATRPRAPWWCRWGGVILLVAACLLPEASAQLNGYRRVHSWGSNRFGELGIDHVEGQASQAKENQCDPQFVPTLGHEALGPEGANLQRIVSGQNHVVAVTQEGDMYVWGRNDMGQLGLGFQGAEDTRTRYKPTLLELFSANGVKLEVIDVALGLEHTVVLVSGGRVYAWGSNQHGQLGIDVTPDLTPFTSVPTAIDVGGESVMNVSAAAGHNVALSFTGGVYTWGANQEGQLGLGGCESVDGRGGDPCLNYVKKPTKIIRTAEGSFMPQMKLVAAGGHVAGGTDKVLDGGHTLSVSLDDEVWGWGDNFHGQVGKRQDYAKVANFAEVYTPNKFDNVTGKYYNREVMPVRVGPLVVTTSQPPPPPPPPAFPSPPGTVVQNDTALTAAAEEDVNVPEIIQIKAGSHHSLALVRTGEIFAWGDNFFGQLGLGYQSLQREPDRFFKTQWNNEPEMIDTPTRIEHFDYVTVETKTEMQGNVSVQVEYTVQVTGKIEWELDARVTQIDAGFFQSIALSSKGNIYTWGTNSLGQQGTCGCGACMHNYEAADTCAAITAPPAPPSPETADTFFGTSEENYEFVPNYANYIWEQECECSCAGAGTCVYTPPQGDTDAINAGFCVGFGADTKCECTPPYLDMTGYIWKMDQPMHFALGVDTNFSFVGVAAGGAMFAISQSPCPTDDVGTPCSGIGECLEAEEEDALSTCLCPFGTAGIYCEHSCPVGTEEDYLAVRADHNIDKFPNSRYREDTDGVMTGEVCSGHGTCDDKGDCLCDEFWYGERCQHMCPWDDFKQHCSNNGVCVYDVSIQETPFCKCNAYNTMAEDEVAAQEALDQCTEQGMQIQANGWCSYFDANLGFDKCYYEGLCGVCEDKAGARGRYSMHLTLLLCALSVFLV